MLQNITFPNFSELCHVFATQQTMLTFFLCQEYHTSLHESLRYKSLKLKP